MNDYQKRNQAEAIKIRSQLEPIAKILGWMLEPASTDPDSVNKTCYMTNTDGLTIRASVPWNNNERFEFMAIEWPTYISTNGKKETIVPSSLGRDWINSEFVNREKTPVTTTARTRNPKAIAKQIQNRLIPEYLRIYALLAELSDRNQNYSNRENAYINQLFDATQEPKKEGSKPYKVMNCKGDTIHVGYRSSGSVQIELHVTEMVEVINFLRNKRNTEQS